MRGIGLSAALALPLVGLLALPGLAAAAGVSDLPQLPAPNITPSEITWTVTESGFAGFELTVSRPDGRVVRYRFPAGKVLTFSLFDAAGSPQPAGIYHYELRANPKRSTEAIRAPTVGGEPGQASSVSSTSRGAAQAGVFSIRDGAFVIPTAKETPPSPENHEVAASHLGSTSARDQVTADDLIVQGSECIGTDCVNNESLGTDTLRLKQNNVRIKLEDTSSTSSFPSNDWQLTANDSVDGGANRFSIDDVDGGTTPFTVTAGAPSNSIFVDGSGRVGLGTSTPAADLQVTTGDTPTLRLEQNSSSGQTAQTWDVAGDEAGFFVRDVTGSGELPFRIRSGAPTSSIDIAANGNVGLGTATPTQRLHLKTTAAEPIRFQLENSAQAWVFGLQSDGKFQISRNGSGVQEMLINAANADVTFAGTVTTGGPTCGGGCDRVLEPGYELESIEQHADEMWKNSYLPAVGPTPARAPFNITEKTGGILNELEKAHIYIAELNEKTRAKDQRLTEMSQELSALKAQEAKKEAQMELEIAKLQERLERLEAALSSKGQQ